MRKYETIFKTLIFINLHINEILFVDIHAIQKTIVYKFHCLPKHSRFLCRKFPVGRILVFFFLWYQLVSSFFPYLRLLWNAMKKLLVVI